MKNLVLEISLRDAGRAMDAICDSGMNAQLEQEASNVWVSSEALDEDDMEMMVCDVEDVMLRYGVCEYEITEKYIV